MLNRQKKSGITKIGIRIYNDLMTYIYIVYATDEEPIKEILCFFSIYSLHNRINTKFFGIQWQSGSFSKIGLRINKYLETERYHFKGFPPSSKVMVVNLPQRDEIKAHRAISAYLKNNKSTQLNPFSAAIKAEDKYLSLEKIGHSGITVPEHLLLTWEDRESVWEKVSNFVEKYDVKTLYIQPNFGTEGRELYCCTDLSRRGFISTVILNMLQSQPVILKKGRGNVYYMKEKEKGYRQVVFRILLWVLRDKPEMDYGFLEVADSQETAISSPEKGGSIVDWENLYSHLYVRQESGCCSRLVLTQEEISLMKKQSEHVYYAFNKNLKNRLSLMGIDFLLEVQNGKLIPIFLEVNPRPAGLNNIRRIL